MAAQAKVELVKVNDEEHPMQFVVLSKIKDDQGMAQFDRHTLAEQCWTEEEAVWRAEHRAAQGYWVDVYRELYYHTGAPQG